MATIKNVGKDGLTVNDRAEMLAKAVGASRPKIAQMLMLDHTYFSTCSGLRLSNRVVMSLQTIFGGLDLNWFKNGDGEFNPSKIEIPIEHLRLIDGKNSPFRKLMSDPNGEAAAVQYIQDFGVDPYAFADKYRYIYPALAKFGLNRPQQEPHPAEPASISQPVHTPEPIPTSTLSELIALTREQQRTINTLADQVRDLQAIVIKYINTTAQKKGRHSNK